MSLLNRLNNSHKYVLVRKIETGSYRINATITKDQMRVICRDTYFDESKFNGKDCVKVMNAFTYGSDNGIQVFFFIGDLIMLYNDWIDAKG